MHGRNRMKDFYGMPSLRNKHGKVRKRNNVIYKNELGNIGRDKEGEILDESNLRKITESSSDLIKVHKID